MDAPLPTSHVSTKMEKFKTKLARAKTWNTRIRLACDDSYDKHRQRCKSWGKYSDRISSAKREFSKLKQLRRYLLLILDRLDDIERWSIYWEYAETVPAELRIAMRWAYQWIEKLDICLDAFDKFYARLDEKEEEACTRSSGKASREPKTKNDQLGEKGKSQKRRQTSSWGSWLGLAMLCGVKVD